MNKLVMISNILDDFFRNNTTTALNEKQAGMSVDFIAENQKFLSYKIDKKLDKKEFPRGIFPFFKSKDREKKVCSFCDYIIFSELKGTLFILLIELKKGEGKVTEQLEAGKCFVEFVMSTVNRVYEQNISAEIRKISIREYKMRKDKPKQKQKSIRYDGDNFHTFEDSKFYLKKYLV